MSDPPETPLLRRSAGKLSLRKKLLFSLLATVGFFLILEGSLTLLGVARVTDTSDPYVGFDHQVPLMQVSVDESGEEIVSTAANKLVWFNSQSFPKNKLPGTQRIVCLGGSTTFGRPYQDLTSYSGWLREFLPLADPTAKWEVINAGGVSYASYRVATVMEELCQYEPDLFIIYTAHNEFLERRTYAGMFEQSRLSFWANSTLRRTRTWSTMQTLVDGIRPAKSEQPKEKLAAEVDEMLNHSIGPAQYHRDAQWRKNVVSHYEANLHRMVTIAQSVGAAVVFITPASNEKDCSPFKSEAGEDVSDEDQQRFAEAVDLADSQIEAGQFDEALAKLSEAKAIDDHHAHLHYKIGRLLFRMERYGEAQKALSRAINEDICPLRAVNEITASIHRVCRQRNVPLVDFDAQLHAKCLSELGHECLGGEYFLDHVHPTIDVHQQLALWILRELGRNDLAKPRALTSDEIAMVDKQVRSQIDQHAQGVSLRNLAKVLHWAGKFEEAAPRAIDALNLIQDDAESRFVLADCLKNLGQPDAAFQQYEKIFARGDYPRAYLPFGDLLAQRGELEAAKSYLTLAAVFENTSQHRAHAQYLLGCIHLELEEFEYAEQSLTIANDLYPHDAVTQALLAEAKVGMGKSEEAIDLYQRVLDLDRTDSETHKRLGLLFLKTKRFDEAIHHFESALAVDPSNEEVQKNVAIAKKLKSNL